MKIRGPKTSETERLFPVQAQPKDRKFSSTKAHNWKRIGSNILLASTATVLSSALSSSSSSSFLLKNTISTNRFLPYPYIGFQTCHRNFSYKLLRNDYNSFVKQKNLLKFSRSFSRFDLHFDSIKRQTYRTMQSITEFPPEIFDNDKSIRNYVDVHCHFIHEQFEGDEDNVANRAKTNGLEYCIVNGLEPQSNRKTLELCESYQANGGNLLPAVGIYPLDATCQIIANRPEIWTHDFPPPTPFNIEDEIAWIDQMCEEKKVIAVGECGMDGFYITDAEGLNEQERVLRLLCQVAKKHDLPIILHTRKAEARVLDILLQEGVTKADFHCFCGKKKLAKKIADHGYYLSIPSAIHRLDSFKQIVSEVPMDKILTETDSPYQAPFKGMRNEPSTVPLAVKTIAQIKGMSEAETADYIRANFQTLFNC